MLLRLIERLYDGKERNRYYYSNDTKVLARGELKRYLKKIKGGDKSLNAGTAYGFLEQFDEQTYFDNKFLGAGLASYLADMYWANEIECMVPAAVLEKNPRRPDSNFLNKHREQSLKELSAYFGKPKLFGVRYEERLKNLITKWKSDECANGRENAVPWY